MARERSKTEPASPKIDLEALGLVLLAFGLAALGLLLPMLPTGALGELVQGALVGRLGWGAYALPWPVIVMGGLFLLRRSPPGWPRVTFGYLLTAAGAWSLLMLIAPERAGAWGEHLRALLTGFTGALAYVPAVLLVTFGIEAMLGWRPSRIPRRAAVAAAGGVRRSGRAFWAARRRARERAAFRADVALVRRALQALDADLAALARLYPGSAELERWRERVVRTRGALPRVDREALAEAEDAVDGWRETLAAFARDRAAELAPRLRAEGLREFEPWSRQRKEQLDEAVAASSAAARGLNAVRQALTLDLAALMDRYRQLVRERDHAEAALASTDARGLVQATEAHGRRLAAYREVADAAARLEEDAGRLEAWRDLVGREARLLGEFAAYGELADYDRSLADDLAERGRAVLAQRDGWAEALDAVELRARQDAQRREREAREAEEAARAAAEDAARPEAEALAHGHGGAEREAAAASATRAGRAVDPDALLDDEDLVAVVEARGSAGAAAQRTARAADVRPGVAGAPEPPADRAGGDASAQDEPPFTPDEAEPDPSRGAPRAADGGAPEVGGIPIEVPSLDLLEPLSGRAGDPEAQAREVQMRVRRIDETLANFNLQGRVVSSVRGPTVTRFEVEPAPGEKISRFANLADDLALAMAASSVRIEAPIPGKGVIGLEVPNSDRDLIRFRESAEGHGFRRARARLPLILGKSIEGEMVVGDLAKMPHLLIAGSTGSGKSVAVNTIIASLLFKFLPTELRLLMIDPKMVELTPYDGIPHLIRPVVTNPNDAAGVLLGAVAHMERRYKMMSRIGAKNLDQYNEKARNLDLPHLPFMVIVIDELADLMITSPKEVESAIMRLAQMARATGMHLVLATQRPSVDILTSLIKVNVPARVAFAVSSGHDSRTILDTMGAERLVGLGDMLFYQPGMTKPTRLQGPYVGEDEIATLASYLRRQYFDDEFVEAYGDDFEPVSADDSDASGMIDWNDDKLRQAAEMVVREGQASVSRLQRRLQVGHARAGKLMDSLEALGVVGPHTGSKPREVLVAFEELPDVFGR